MPFTLHPTEAGLLRAICENPADDDVRLIYADWLEENGQEERGDFVRVQIELAKLRAQGCHEAKSCNVTGQCVECLRDVAAEPLRRRERELLQSHGIQWAAPVGEVLGTADRVTFRRGFVAEVFCRLVDWCGRPLPAPHDGRGEDLSAINTLLHEIREQANPHGHGPAIVLAAPLERVTLAEWRGKACRYCSAGYVPTDRDDNTCEVCHGLYNSRFALAWARRQAGLPALS